jgi:hypothetical protein
MLSKAVSCIYAMKSGNLCFNMIWNNSWLAIYSSQVDFWQDYITTWIFCCKYNIQKSITLMFLIYSSLFYQFVLPFGQAVNFWAWGKREWNMREKNKQGTGFYLLSLSSRMKGQSLWEMYKTRKFLTLFCYISFTPSFVFLVVTISRIL